MNWNPPCITNLLARILAKAALTHSAPAADVSLLVDSIQEK